MPVTCSTADDRSVPDVTMTDSSSLSAVSLEVALLTEAPGWEALVAGGLPEAEALVCEAARSACRAALEDPAAQAASPWLAGLRRATPPLELGVVLSDDARVAHLNRDYRGRDGATNVLSFASCTRAELSAGPPAGLPLLLGDVVLARETAEREARTAGRPVAAHVLHLVVHGVLHLFGFDHGDDREAAVMEAAEARVLAVLGVADPYAGNRRPPARRIEAQR